MAQSRNFFGMRRGSTKTFTFQVNHGVQITKDRVYDVANPRTNAQMGQRLAFANAVKFYKAANQNLFKFAYEDKKPNESDYNAFMRHNTGLAAIASKKMLVNDYPAIGNYMLTAGTLGTLDVFCEANTSLGVRAYLDIIIDVEGTVGSGWREICEKYPQIHDGDIVTLAVLYNKHATNVKTLEEAIAADALCTFPEGKVNSTDWQITQVRVDFSDTTPQADASGPVIRWAEMVEDKVQLNMLVPSEDIDKVCGACLIVSRPVGASEVLVTNSGVIASPATQVAINIGRGSEWKRHVAETYEFNADTIDADAILKGEIVGNEVKFAYDLKEGTFTTQKIVGTITDALNVGAEGVTVTVSKSGEASTYNFVEYMNQRDENGNSHYCAIYCATLDLDNFVGIEVEGTTLKAGGVIIGKSSAAASITNITA